MVPPSAMGLAPDLRKRIEIMAEHISRNGPDFEATVRQKNVSNPQFAFLYKGEGSEYYAQVLAQHRGGGPGAAMTRPSAAAVHQPATVSLVDPALAALCQRWKEPPVFPLAGDMDRQLDEALAALEQMASRDLIRNGRVWIECNSAIAPQIASQIMKRLVFIQTCSHRLHVLYLVHDVLQTEAARKDGMRPLIRAFKQYLPWILRPAYQLAQSASPSGEEGAKVLRLLQLWVERGIIVQSEAEDMRALATPSQLPLPSQVRVTAAQLPRPPPAGTPAVVRTPPPARPPTAVMPGVRPMGMPVVGSPYAGQSAYLAGPRPPVPGLAPNQVLIPGTLMPGVHGYRPEMLQRGVTQQTAETLPVGVLATLCMKFSRRTQGRDFMPYKPLDPAITPQALPPMEVPSQRLLQRIEDFYQDLRDEEHEDSASSSSRSSSRSRSRSGSGDRSRSRSPAGLGAAPTPMALGGFMSAVPPPVD
uniref:CID domain-containing protein n=1 Tax=Alexandrium catenella TaxID=2925 RepID=A0A7S1RVK3_ALECA|mmetsp:Transcript_74488/g.197854  ORF Transcript_74488/g.197854 Transcript_74488/m.197854 type:complete len:474 (+) Transcript_74488:77-1498(+)